MPAWVGSTYTINTLIFLILFYSLIINSRILDLFMLENKISLLINNFNIYTFLPVLKSNKFSAFMCINIKYIFTSMESKFICCDDFQIPISV